MKILIPTAKEMNLNVETTRREPLSVASQAVLEDLAAYTVQDLATLYQIKEERAEEEYQHIQALKTQTAKTYPALELFDGLMYRNIRRQNLEFAEKNYLEDHLLITSSLYGVIPAYGTISPHRLDFMMKLKVAGKSLKQHWKEEFDAAVKGEDVLLSLLSSEFEMVFSKVNRDKMIRFKFLEEKEGQLKVHSTISKKARGQFLTALMEHQVEDLAVIKDMSFAGFSFREDLSHDQEYVFVKTV
ncbi:peroxide stress protein YaaA [Streptococcus pneumoniae]